MPPEEEHWLAGGSWSSPSDCDDGGDGDVGDDDDDEIVLLPSLELLPDGDLDTKELKGAEEGDDNGDVCFAASKRVVSVGSGVPEQRLATLFALVMDLVAIIFVAFLDRGLSQVPRNLDKVGSVLTAIVSLTFIVLVGTVMQSWSPSFRIPSDNFLLLACRVIGPVLSGSRMSSDCSLCRFCRDTASNWAWMSEYSPFSDRKSYMPVSFHVLGTANEVCICSRTVKVAAF